MPYIIFILSSYYKLCDGKTCFWDYTQSGQDINILFES